MKKFISMVMAAAMVVSLVPATAFAYEVTSTAKVLDVCEMTEAEADNVKTSGIVGSAQGLDVPELQVKIADAEYTNADKTTDAEYEFDLKLSKAKWVSNATPVTVDIDEDGATEKTPVVTFSEVDEDEATVTLKFAAGTVLEDDDVVVINLGGVKVTKTAAGSEAKVTIKSDDLGVKAEDLVFAVVADNVLEISVDDMTDLSIEEITTMEDVTIEAATGTLPKDDADGEDLKLKLNKGFVFADVASWTFNVTKGTGSVAVDMDNTEDNVAYLNVTGSVSKFDIVGMDIEAETANEGDVATLTVSATEWEKASVEIATVVAEGLSISVDEDEDVPEMWSGVKNGTVYLTDDCDNEALTITIKESVAGAFNEKDEVELRLPEGVWVVAATANQVEGTEASGSNNWTTLMQNAYKEGDHQSFVFEKRTIKETAGTAYEIEIDMTIVADPGFVGDVVAELIVDGEKVGEATIATFKAPIIVEAQSNDLKIDYRNTEIGSDIVVKEAEAGLWSKALSLGFTVEKFGNSNWEDDMVYTVNEDESGMEIDGDDDMLFFEIDDESDEEAGVVTISNMSLYMDRNLAAGAYDLKMYGDCFADYKGITLFAADAHKAGCAGSAFGTHDCDAEVYVDDVCDFSDVVKEGFINIVTAGREQDDASFTTKVVVPVGESYIVAGENTVTLDVPAYVSEAGYTMLPVRAVATALGINNNNVLWDAATKTVTILYGQRIITMQVGSKVINVNGSAIPASASVEIVNGRTFLPMRDLATALGVTDITWDAATKTATLNGNI